MIARVDRIPFAGNPGADPIMPWDFSYGSHGLAMEVVVRRHGDKVLGAMPGRDPDDPAGIALEAGFREATQHFDLARKTSPPYSRQVCLTRYKVDQTCSI